jgi:hypothetical protein
VEIVCPPPLRAACLRWQARRGAFAVTVVCKATFRLQPGTAAIVEAGEPVLTADEFWEGDPGRSLRASSDLVPFKPRAEVVLVGSAFAPRKEPVRSLITRLLVGSVDKSITVNADRFYRPDGALQEGARFAKMPLRWERTTGGPGTNNPVGVWLEGPPDGFGRKSLPNLEPPGTFSLRPDQNLVPIGYGPIAASWPERRERLGRMAAVFPADGTISADVPLLNELDPLYFNAAPRDQQLDEIRSDERLMLENLHPEHARLTTNLPSIAPYAWAERSRGNKAMPMRADTLWIDTDRGLCTLTFRGSIGLEHPNEVVRFVIALEPPRSSDDSETTRTITGLAARATAALPFDAGAAAVQTAELSPAPADDAPMELSSADLEETFAGQAKAAARLPSLSASLSPAMAAMSLDGDTMKIDPGARRGSLSGLPFKPAGAKPAEPPPVPITARAPSVPAPPPSPLPGVIVPPGGAPAPVPPPPIASPPVAPPPIASPPIASPPIAPPPVAAPPVAPPPLVWAKPPPEVTNAPASPWAGGSPGLAGTTIGEARVEATRPALPTLMGVGSEASRAASPPAEEEPKKAEPAPESSPRPAPAAETRNNAPRIIVKLLYFDRERLPQVRSHEAWKVKLLERELFRLDAADARGEEPAPISERSRTRRDFVEVLVHAEATGADAVRTAFQRGIGEDGRFEAPLVLLAGELSLPFDELSTLKATVAAMRPLSAGDKRLIEALDAVEELTRTPWLEGSSGVSEGLLARVREAFVQAKRAVALADVEAHTERMLLERRCYQTRALFGKKWIRALLRGEGGEVPVYLPEALKEELPLFKRFPARIIAEVEPREDQYESSLYALKTIALGRVLSGG